MKMMILFCALVVFGALQELVSANKPEENLGEVAWTSIPPVFSGDECHISVPDGALGDLFGKTKDGR